MYRSLWFFCAVFMVNVLLFTACFGMLHTIAARDFAPHDNHLCMHELVLSLSTPSELVFQAKNKRKNMTTEQLVLSDVQYAPTLDVSNSVFPYNPQVGYGYTIKNNKDGISIVVTYNPEIIIFHYDLPIESRNCLDTVVTLHFYSKKIKNAIEQKSNPIISIAYNAVEKKIVFV